MISDPVLLNIIESGLKLEFIDYSFEIKPSFGSYQPEDLVIIIIIIKIFISCWLHTIVKKLIKTN